MQSIERYSLKYTGIIDGKDLAEQIGRFKVDLHLGKYQLKAEPFSIRVEIRDGELLDVVQLAAPASVALSNGTTRTGTLVDIDGICEHKTSDLREFSRELPEKIEHLHTRDKRGSFGPLTPETLAYLEPTYVLGCRTDMLRLQQQSGTANNEITGGQFIHLDRHGHKLNMPAGWM